MSGIHLLNFASVSIFGMILSASFCDILWTRKKVSVLAGVSAMMLFVQGSIWLFLDPLSAKHGYPLMIHLPLAIVLCILSKKRLWPVVSVLAAYLCCQIRRWLALLMTAVLGGDEMMQSVAELAITLPLLLLLVRFAAPAVRSLSCHTISVQCQFGMIPAVYYGFDYLTRIYTDLLTEGVMVAVEFMPFVCCVAYLMFVLHISAAERIRAHLEQTKDTLHMQITQAVREIESLRESQKKASAYRHDLRHHMQYLLSCIENGKTETARTYIQEICSEIDAGNVTVYCENEAANLIFSAFAGRAGKYDISISIRAALPRVIPISESDLCVLLSNALENALYACRNLKEEGLAGMIDVLAYEKKEKLFLQIENSCNSDITFVNGIPVTDMPGHGIGVRSICAIVEKYGGIYAFSACDGRFLLRLSL